MALPDFDNIKHHPALEEIVDVLCAKTQEQDRGFFRAEVAYFLGKVAATMRAMIVTKDRGEIPVNIYTIALAESGYGKGHSVGVVETEILKGFKARFMEDTLPVISDQSLWVIANNNAARNGTDQQEEYDKVAKDFKSLGAFPFTFDSGSTPAVKQLRQKLLMGNVGAINLQIDEIGSNLLGQNEILTTFLELYDQGMVKQKLKMNTNDQKRFEEIEGKTPTNMMLFGTPSKLFDGAATENEFYLMLEIGYARRCLFGYGMKRKVASVLTPAERAKEIYQDLTSSSIEMAMSKLVNHFYQLADPAIFGWKMEMGDDVGVALLEYRLTCEALAEKMADHDSMRKAEMSHRYFKALKLAGAYAFMDQSTEVEMSHLHSAIKLVEESGNCFHALLNREKAYMRLAKYIAQVGTEVTHADLHEALPFYKSSLAARNEMMSLAIAWGYKKHIVIKKSFTDGIELFKGETLQETDLSKINIAYSDHWAYGYQCEAVPFDKLHIVAQQAGYHWANHHFKAGHRSEENVIAGFNAIVIDVDGGISLDAAHELMRDYKFFTYTTKSHLKEGKGERFRLVLPTNYRLELDQDEYKEFMNNVLNWLPFESDESANQRSKKWESFEGGQYHYNLEAASAGDKTPVLLDVLDFIPKTTRNEQYKQQSQDLGSLDNLERWFAGRIASGNRNNQMIKYALCLVDAGWDLPSVRNQVHEFNKKLSESMTPQEIDSTIMVSVAKRFQQAA